ncbi:COP9 signalosome subunit 1 (CsnA) [Penicillium argentinense]|uniref:COP9 signalosome complex subunit 1 n=1 Tax=Penicillium argentinense TaxID=1131581 RepID=A0A9W9JXR3_9EURO|nr:COP9 signalosome subunit 1 (CsnA) [Penicillium argentinense]KAJ5085468.1 COP9 signalosome subunit 1 (CsnA) [Penicillium argentinense]
MEYPPQEAFSSAPQGTTASFGEATPASVTKLDDPPKFDLESYIANYKGRTRFNRLYLIGITSTYLSVDALKAAISEAKSGKDVARYEKAVRALSEVAPGDHDATLDSAWVQQVQKGVKAEGDQLERELRGYKNNLIKESIRMGNEDMGNHYYETGDLVAASKAYSRMRDYCTTPNHIASMLFKLINVGVERGDWLSVTSNVQRLRNSQSKPEDLARNQAKISAALGLAQMHGGFFRDAATSFLSVKPTLGDTFNDIVTPNDIAVYGGLCAMASMDRTELQTKVLDNVEFRNFLELEPHIRHAIKFFINSKFRPLLDILDNYRTDYLLDIHLHRHVADLYEKIRIKAIQQYLVPFSVVILDTMAAIFSPEVVGGEAHPASLKSPFVKELVRLIQEKVLDARLDLEKGLLIVNEKDTRIEAQEKILKDVRKFNEEMHLQILRASVLQAGMELRAPNQESTARFGHVSAARRGLGGSQRGGPSGSK